MVKQAARRWFVALCLSLGLVAGARAADVVTTTGMIADVAGNVAGECLSVEPLMGPGIDPHLYEARPSDIPLLRNADAILYNGFNLEGQLGAVLAKMAKSRPTVAVGPESMKDEDLIKGAGGYAVDPHLWMDASLWARIVPTVADVLSKVAPECESGIRERAERYQAQLLELHDWVDASVASVPEQQRILITAHDAFRYFGLGYGIEVVGIQGISTDSEAAIADIRSVVDRVVSRNVPAIFVESTISRRTVETVVGGARDQGHEVTIGGELYSDAMGPGDTPEGTYIGMLRHNTETIVESLGGSVEPWPESLPSPGDDGRTNAAE